MSVVDAIGRATEAFDFTNLTQTVIVSQNVSEKRARELVEEYRRYIFLIERTRQRLPMASPVVDKIWHLHLEMSVDYTRMCDALKISIGHDKDAAYEDVINFRELYERHFGPLGSDWCDPTDGKPFKQTLCVPTIRPSTH